MGTYTTIVNAITEICKNIVIFIVFIILIFILGYKLIHFIQKATCTEGCDTEKVRLVLGEIIGPTHSTLGTVITSKFNGSGNEDFNVILAEFYPPNFVLVTFEDHRIIGQYYAKYEIGRNNDDFSMQASLGLVQELSPIYSKNNLKQKLNLGEPTARYDAQGIQLVISP